MYPNPPRQATLQKCNARYRIFRWLVSMLLAALTVGWVAFSSRSRALRDTLKGHQGRVMCLAFSSDGRTLATGGEDRTVRLWDLPSGKPRAILKEHTDKVVAVVFSPDSRL